MNWRDHEVHLDVVTSTMDSAKILARANAPEGTTVIAHAQTDGHGRRGRYWFAQPGGSVLATTILRPKDGANDPLLSLVVAVGIGAGLQACGVVDFVYKWPNDILWRDRKLAGILLYGGDPQGVVLAGFGVNVMSAKEACVPTEIAAAYIGVNDLLTAPISVSDVAFSILDALQSTYNDYQNKGPEKILVAYTARDALLGHRVNLDVGERCIEGVAMGVEPSGALRVNTAGVEMVVMAGEVNKVRY